MEKIGMAEARKMAQALGEKCFKGVTVVDSLDGEFVIEDNGNYFTVEIHPHKHLGQPSPQVLERFKAIREFRRKKNELTKS